MTLLDDRPAATEQPIHRPVRALQQPAVWRLALRMAGRETMRRPGRTVLAASLIAVPVFAMTLGSVLVRTDRDDFAALFERNHGASDIVVNPALGFSTDDAVPAGSVDGLPAGTEVDTYVWTGTSVIAKDAPGGALTRWGIFTDIMLRDGGDGQPIEVIEGRAPDVGEILVDAETARRLGVELGGDVALERPSGTWTLVGLGRLRNWHDEGVFVVPGFDRSRLAEDWAQFVTTYDLPDGTTPSETRRLAAQLGGVDRFTDPFPPDTVGTQIAWGWVGGALALVAVGIIVSAAFATSARRQLVTIGQLASNGATPTTIHRTLALQGTWTGLAGAVVGVGAGLAVLPFARPLAEAVVSHDLPPFRISALDLVLVIVTATVAGTIAAAVPARSAARIPVMAALAGRRPIGRLPRWLVPTGVVLTGGGLGLAALGGVAASTSTTSDNWFALVIVGGLVALVFGMVCATPLAIETVGRLGSRASLSWRLALRGLARSRTRSSAVVAAIAVAVGGAVAASALIETTVRENRAGWIATVPADTVVARVWGEPGYGDGEQPFDLAPLTDAEPPAELRAELARIVPGATFAPLRFATYDAPRFDPGNDVGPWPDPYGAAIADEALLEAIGLDAVDIRRLDEQGALLPVSPDGYSPYFGEVEPREPGDATVLTRRFVTESGPIDLVAATAERPYEYGIGGSHVLVTEAHARELGFDIVTLGVIVTGDRPLSAEQRASLTDVSTRIAGVVDDAFVEPGDPDRRSFDERRGQSGGAWEVTFDEPEWREGGRDDVWIARAIVLGVALGLTLLVVAIGLSLAAAEGRLERDTLAVVGATPASMRRQSAARAATLTLCGIALGIPTGFLPAWVLYRIANDADPLGTTLEVPWLILAALVVAVPAVVATVSWIGAGVAQRLNPPRPVRLD